MFGASHFELVRSWSGSAWITSAVAFSTVEPAPEPE